jgi:adenylate kinase
MLSSTQIHFISAFAIAACLGLGFYLSRKSREKRNDHSSQLRILLLGIPTSGKTNQANLLSQYYNIPAISSSALIKKAISDHPEKYSEIESVMNKGGLVPSELMIQLMQQRLKKPDCQNGFIIDGFPVKIEEAKTFETPDKKINIAIELQLSEEELKKRVDLITKSPRINTQLPSKKPVNTNDSNTRADDTAEVLQKRINTYKENLQTIRQFYNNKSIYFSVLGDGTIDNTNTKIRAIIDSVISKKTGVKR